MTSDDESGEKYDFSPVPGWSAEVGTRLRSVVKQLGGNEPAGRLAGVTDEMISRYVRGRAKMPLFVAAALMAAAGRSVDWLINGDSGHQTGGGSVESAAAGTLPFERELFRAVSRIVKDAHAAAGIRLPPAALEDITYDKYERIAGRGLSGERLAGALDYLAADLQAELNAAKATPGAGKRVG